MKHLFFFFIVFAFAIISSFANSSQIKLVTDKAIGEVFYFSMSVTKDLGMVEVDFGDGDLKTYLLPEGSSVKFISGELKANTVIIHTNSSDTYNIYCSESGLTELVIGENVFLNDLWCYSNNLTELDLTNCQSLTRLVCYWNSLTSLKLEGCNQLSYLSCQLNELPDIDVSTNTNLEHFFCYSNKLTELDISKNIALKRLHCDSNYRLGSLDVSQNRELVEFFCSSTGLKSLDISNNDKLVHLKCSYNAISSLNLNGADVLKYLNCFRNQLTSIDVSGNDKLTSLACSVNQLTELDVTRNVLLDTLYCNENKIETLNLDNNPAMKLLWCNDNDLTFKELPLRALHFDKFNYSPQAVISIQADNILGEYIDLSNQYDIDGTFTSYTWKTKSGNILVEYEDYEIVDGITTFKVIPADSVYCELRNEMYPELVLYTSNVKVDVSTNNDELLKKEVVVSSNDKMINISGVENDKVMITDIQGKIIFSQFVNSEVSLSVKGNSVYIISIYLEEGRIVKKIMVN